MGMLMPLTIIEEICANANISKAEVVITFCQALDRLRSLGFNDEVDAIEDLVSILFLRLLDIYSSTNMYM